MPAPPVDLAALRRLAEAATPGPWRSFDDYGYTSPVNGLRTNIVPSIKKTNAAYIAAANPATLLTLLDRITELEAERPTE
jgi:hypothetical protein